jgi:hypothetical protein
LSDNFQKLDASFFYPAIREVSVFKEPMVEPED